MGCIGLGRDREKDRKIEVVPSCTLDYAELVLLSCFSFIVLRMSGCSCS